MATAHFTPSPLDPFLLGTNPLDPFLPGTNPLDPFLPDSNHLSPMPAASEADVSLTSQLITHLTVSSAVTSKTKVVVGWAGPICSHSGFYITTQVDGFSEENRTEVAAAVACSPDGGCSAEVRAACFV